MADFTTTATDVSIHASAEVPTLADAQALAAAFPKSVKVRATTLGTYIKDDAGNPVPSPDGEWKYQNITVGLVTFTANLYADGVNKGRNETGIKRFRSFLRHAASQGHTVSYTTPYTNSLSAAEYEELAG